MNMLTEKEKEGLKYSKLDVCQTSPRVKNKDKIIDDLQGRLDIIADMIKQSTNRARLNESGFSKLLAHEVRVIYNMAKKEQIK